MLGHTLPPPRRKRKPKKQKSYFKQKYEVCLKVINAFLSMSIYLLEHAMGKKELPKARFSSF